MNTKQTIKGLLLVCLMAFCTSPSLCALAEGPEWYFTSNYVYFYDQGNTQNCVPMAARLMLHNLNGYAPSLSAVISGCGTNSGGTYYYRGRDYLNTQQTKGTYQLFTWGSNDSSTRDGVIQTEDEVADMLYETIVTQDAVPMLMINAQANQSNGWPINIGGNHAVSVSGVRPDKSSFRIANSWSGSYADFTVSRTALTRVNRLYGAGLIRFVRSGG